MLQRLQKELKDFQTSPLHNTAVEWSEERLDVWIVAMYGLFKDDPDIPLSFWIHFDKEYPIKPPSVGFNCSFPFSEGASYIVRDKENVLFGKYVICLNILGNFANLHGEWSTTKGEGWTSTCDISYLLCQLFVVIGDNLKFTDTSPSCVGSTRQAAHDHEVRQAALAFKAYTERNPVPRLKVPLFTYPRSVSFEQRERIEVFFHELPTIEKREEFKTIIAYFLLEAERRVTADKKQKQN